MSAGVGQHPQGGPAAPQDGPTERTERPAGAAWPPPGSQAAGEPTGARSAVRTVAEIRTVLDNLWSALVDNAVTRFHGHFEIDATCPACVAEIDGLLTILDEAPL